LIIAHLCSIVEMLVLFIMPTHGNHWYFPQRRHMHFSMMAICLCLSYAMKDSNRQCMHLVQKQSCWNEIHERESDSGHNQGPLFCHCYNKSVVEEICQASTVCNWSSRACALHNLKHVLWLAKCVGTSNSLIFHIEVYLADILEASTYSVGTR